MKTRSQERKEGWTGQNWIRPEKRLAVYLRDSLACVWCQAGIEDEGTVLTLDHVVPYAQGGLHDAANLVTACKRCNSSRGTRSVAKFARAVAEYLDHAADPAAIRARVRAAARRALDLDAAKKMIEQRGSCKRAMDAMEGR